MESSVVPDYLEVGRVLRAHGVHGAFIVDVITNRPERFKSGAKFYLGPDRDTVTIEEVSPYKGRLLVRVDGCSDRTAAQHVQGQVLAIPTEDVGDPPKGEFWSYTLVGLPVTDIDDHPLGKVTAVMDNPAHNLLVCVDNEGREWYVPMVTEFIEALDVDEGIVRIRAIPGLLPE